MDTTNQDPSAHECDNCGAPLPAADDTGTRRCTFCKSVYRTPAPAAAPLVPPQAIVFQTVAEPLNGGFKPINESSTSASRGCGIGTLVLLIIVAAVGISVYAAAKGGFDSIITGPGLTFAEADPLVLPGEPSGPMAFVTMTSRYDSGKSASVFSMVKSDGVSSKPVWTTDLPAGQGFGERPIVTDGTNAITAIDDEVVGVSLATGAVSWSTTLTDVVQFSNCNGCFEQFGTSLVVISADGNVQGIDTTTGTAAWSRRLESTQGRGYRTGGHVVVFDDAPDGGYQLVTLDPATGAEVVAFSPACADPSQNEAWQTDLSSSSALLASTTPDRMWFVDGSSPTCIQQYDVTTGAMVSEALADDDGGSISSSPVMIETPLGLVITSWQTLAVVDPSGTTFRRLPSDPDIELHVFGATPNAILATTVNRRGSTTTSIRAIDPNTGATFWDAPMGKATVVDTEDAEPGRFNASSASQEGVYAPHLDGGVVHVVTFREFNDNTQQLVLDSFDAVTGSARGSVTLAGGSEDIIPELGPGVWTGSRLLTTVGDGQMNVIDLASMTVAYRFA